MRRRKITQGSLQKTVTVYRSFYPSHVKATVTENSVRGYFTRIGEAGNSTSKDSCEGPSLFLCNLIINKRYSLKFDFLISCS